VDAFPPENGTPPKTRKKFVIGEGHGPRGDFCLRGKKTPELVIKKKRGLKCPLNLDYQKIDEISEKDRNVRAV